MNGLCFTDFTFGLAGHFLLQIELPVTFVNDTSFYFDCVKIICSSNKDELTRKPKRRLCQFCIRLNRRFFRGMRDSCVLQCWDMDHANRILFDNNPHRRLL
jgi:hypothetical protein